MAKSALTGWGASRVPPDLLPFEHLSFDVTSHSGSAWFSITGNGEGKAFAGGVLTEAAPAQLRRIARRMEQKLREAERDDH